MPNLNPEPDDLWWKESQLIIWKQNIEPKVKQVVVMSKPFLTFFPVVPIKNLKVHNGS